VNTTAKLAVAAYVQQVTPANCKPTAERSGASAFVASRFASAVKTNSTTRTNDASAITTSAADDPELSLPVLGNTTYRVEGYIGVTATTNSGFKAALSFPTLMRTGGIPLGMYAINAGNFITMPVTSATVRGMIASTVAYSNNGLVFWAIFRTATNGTVNFRWAQNASSADETTVVAESSMTLTRLTD
jgi:hypothetical protein